MIDCCLPQAQTPSLWMFPVADLHGVVKLDDLEDTRNILSLIRHTKTAVVVGGGVLAIELVEGLVAQRQKSPLPAAW